MEKSKIEQTAINESKLVQRSRRCAFRSDKVVATGFVSAVQGFPPILQSATSDWKFAAWLASNRESVEEELAFYGALLFRGFNVDSATTLEEVARALSFQLIAENGEHVPVAKNTRVQTPVFYAPERKLLWHNENTFNASWPMRIFFACGLPPSFGGETPLVDSRKLFNALPREIREPFLEKGVMYVRNYNAPLGLPWQKVFMTNDPAEAEEKGRKAGFHFEWKSGGKLKTTCVRPAAYRHMRTHEWCWCNQAQHWHPFCLDEETRAFLLAEFGEENMPRNCYYGDGSPISDVTVKTILETFQQLEVSFPWQSGDLLVIDNLMVAHARNPYSGERKIFVVLADPIAV
jgi:hypothetical protein